MKIKYECDYCGLQYDTEEKCLEEEHNCRSNPKNKCCSACKFYCAFNYEMKRKSVAYKSCFAGKTEDECLDYGCDGGCDKFKYIGQKIIDKYKYY